MWNYFFCTCTCMNACLKGHEWNYHVSILSYCSDTELKMTQVQVC